MTGHEVHVNDVGTVYRVPLFDSDLELENFDPSTATVKKLKFTQPGVTAVIERSATAEQIDIDGVQTWALTYTVLTADVVPGGFHQEAGDVTVQGYIQYSDGRKWHSQILTRDFRGRPLAVVANLGG